MCEKFLIHIHFKEIAILNCNKNLEGKQFDLALDLPISTSKIDVRNEKNATFQNGCQEMEICFILQSENMIDNEDFKFSCFGNGISGK
jgi:hypothetical protein